MSSSLDTVLAAQGAPGWDELFPSKICKGCPSEKDCTPGITHCRAINVIGALAAIVSATDGRSIPSFVKKLREAVEATVTG